MEKGKNQHIVPHGLKWAVRGLGNKKFTAVTETKHEAIRIGRRIAMNQKSELFIHRKNGAIENRYSYGNDPYPPKG